MAYAGEREAVPGAKKREKQRNFPNLPGGAFPFSGKRIIIKHHYEKVAGNMQEEMNAIACRFRLEGAPVTCGPYGRGHINSTFLLETDRGRRYILQRINGAVFPDPGAVMENVAAVTEHIARRTEDPRGCLRLEPTWDGALWTRDERGDVWRVYDFVEGGVSPRTPASREELYECAAAFGAFRRQLAGFPAESLRETIPDFHNTPDRYRKLRAALAADVCGRAGEVRREIGFVLARENEAGALQRMRLAGELPVRVTHNDTKLDNVLLDAASGRALCVVDLDTVMPGLAAYDFGDAIRSGAAAAPEDERDLSRMELDMDAFETFTRGFAAASPDLTDRERESLPLGAWIMTLECGVRFLTDYLAGDVYFAVHRPGQNLDRARAQLKLAADMERKWDDMRSAAARICGRVR